MTSPSLAHGLPVAVLTGSGTGPLGAGLAAHLGTELTDTRVERFPDGELDVTVDASIRDHDVYVLQSLGPPANDHLVELLLLLDACRRAGAARLTAVVSYLAYSRKDRRTSPGEAVGLRVVADILESSGATRAVLVDPHVPQVDSIFSIPLEVASAVPLLADAISADLDGTVAVVAPDLGAVHLAERYAGALGIDAVSVIRKTRLSGTEVEVTGLVGSGRVDTAVLVDDIISTGSTLEAAAHELRARWDEPRIVIAATHGLFTPGAAERIERIGADAVAVSDSVNTDTRPAGCRVVGLGPLLAEVIRRLSPAG
jgi:ribose-phosphate pyrophosphokinase